ncbi:putative CUE domain protein [Taphrina deformans PYCC 5710]|uniref:CUE domain protein n=1 Tax=Taphrina deformans (strain PYCC 5710 / ATCC 11124 / CBS 356.35 / IMI 108563 / JCM 9778 / NBRC 8474) TaxID=1097556 RepID=R4XEN7_TAPDE|nr:putative CUE domain protein [Taphrina deformans PYCC 5710]|eukprot:CCG81832.1 putative CUE domain protein [Taphrina deformans PYCC 5710]
MNISVVPIPKKAIRFALEDAQWHICVQSWTRITGLALHLPTTQFETQIMAADTMSTFLLSYLHESRAELHDQLSDNSRRISTLPELSKNVYLLCIRLLKSPRCPQVFLSFTFLSDFTGIFARSNAATVQSTIDFALEDNIDALTTALTDDKVSSSPAIYTTLCAHSNITASLLARSQLARALVSAYESNVRDGKAIRRLCFLILRNKQSSIKFLDAMIQEGQPSRLLRDVLARTTLLDTLKTLATDRPGLEELLHVLQDTQDHYKYTDTITHKADHQDDQIEAAEIISKISQIQDLFPDLGEGYIEACLNEYGGDIETTTMHLLENSLPPHINKLDTKLSSFVGADTKEPARREVPDVPLSVRNNVYDNDEFDRLVHDKRQVSQGRRLSNNADVMMKQQLSLEQKAKVLALAYDPDDDELDDTYEQFEGTTALDHQTNDDLDEATGPSVPSIDDLLFLSYESDPSVFEHSARKSQNRQDLRARTNLSDEQIEGWKVMLDREPARARKLAEKNVFAGEQAEVKSSRWTREESEQAGRPDGRGGARGRGKRGNRAAPENAQVPRTADQIKRDRAKKETRGNGRGRGRGGGMRGQARPQG